MRKTTWAAAVAAAIVASYGFAQAPNRPGAGDEFNTNTRRGGVPPGGGQYRGKADCDGAMREVEGVYGSKPFLLSPEEYERTWREQHERFRREGKALSCRGGLCEPNMLCVLVRIPPPKEESPCGPTIAAAARAVASAIQGGNTRPEAFKPLDDALKCLPPSAPRPIQCKAMMVDAQSKRNTSPDYASKRAQDAVACYEGKDPPGKTQQAQDTPRDDTACERVSAPPPSSPRDPVERAPSPGPGDPIAPGGRRRLRSDYLAPAFPGRGSLLATPVEYRMAQSNGYIKGGIDDGRYLTDVIVKDSGGKCFKIRTVQYHHDVCDWWFALRQNLHLVYERERGSRGLGRHQEISAGFVVTVDSKPEIVHPDSLARFGWPQIVHPIEITEGPVRGARAMIPLAFDGPGAQDPRLRQVIVGALERVQIPPIPKQISKSSEPAWSFTRNPERSWTETPIPQDIDRVSGAPVAHGVYFFVTFGASSDRVFIDCYDYFRTRNQKTIYAAPRDPDPAKNHDLNPN